MHIALFSKVTYYIQILLKKIHIFYCFSWKVTFSGEGQNLERQNVERSIFRNFEIANIKTTKDELFDSFNFEFNFLYFRNPSNDFSNGRINVFLFSKLLNFTKLLIISN